MTPAAPPREQVVPLDSSHMPDDPSCPTEGAGGANRLAAMLVFVATRPASHSVGSTAEEHLRMHSSARMSDHRSQAMKSNESRSCAQREQRPFRNHAASVITYSPKLTNPNLSRITTLQERHHLHLLLNAHSHFELHSNACCTLPQMRSTLNQAAPDAQHTKPCRKDHLEHNSPHAEPSAKLKQFPPCGRTIATSITDRSSTIRSQQSQVTA